MKKLILVFILSLVLFSCKKEVEPSAENINAIINSNEYVITIDIVGGSIVGSFTDQMIIKINNSYLKSKSDFQNSSKKLNDIEMDSLKSILNKLVESHVPDKIPLKSGSCTTSDENYIIENDSIKMKIKPHFNNSIYYEIIRLFK